MTDPMELVGLVEGRIGQDFDGECHLTADEARQIAACIREMLEVENDAIQKREGLEEDLYQAVLVAYRRGAVEWTMLNYPQWINAISAGREVCPPALGAEA